jgi:hypothetical protein
MTVSICGECWFTVDHKFGFELAGENGETFGRHPMRVRDSGPEECHYCSRVTTAGIFVRKAAADEV